MTDAGLHRIAMDTTNTSHGFDGYMSEFVLIDGQQLTPSFFWRLIQIQESGNLNK